MPLHRAIAAFMAVLLFAFVAAIFRPRLEADLGRPRFWLILTGCASLTSKASILISRTAHAGTGFVARHGWPKPYRFDFVGEHGDRSTSFEPLYFVGNVLAHAAIFLSAWSIRRIARGPGGPGRR